MSRLSLLVSSALILFLTGCTIWAQKPAAWSNATGAEELERLWWSEVKAKHWDEVEHHLAGNYVSQSGGSTRDRAQVMEHLRKLDLAEFTIGDVAVHAHGETFVVTYTMDSRGTFDGQPLEMKHVAMMTAWQKQKQGWVAIAHANSSP